MNTTNALPLGTHLTSKRGTYTIKSVLGAGGFGITYRAAFPTKIGNIPIVADVAVKEYFPLNDCVRDSGTASITYGSTAAQRVERSRFEFIKEAECLQRIGGRHPGIVSVNEVFAANNTAYYVMEYLEGMTLKDYVKTHGKLSLAETMALMMPIIDAVDFLHCNKFTHLDIKPSNIMLARNNDGSGVRPVLIDFGLARHYNSDGSATATIQTMGFSDGYSPVEQYSGITSFSPSVDVYALGATILFCLTGKRPPRSVELNPAKLSALMPSDLPREISMTLILAMAFQDVDRLPNARQMFINFRNTCKKLGISTPPHYECPEELDTDTDENNGLESTDNPGGKPPYPPDVNGHSLEKSEEEKRKGEKEEHKKEKEKQPLRRILFYTAAAVILAVLIICGVKLSQSYARINSELSSDSLDTPEINVETRLSTDTIIDYDKVFTAVEKMAEYPGGEAALQMDIARNHKIPKSVKNKDLTGKIIVQFVVTKTGDVGEVKIVRGLDPALDKEIVRTIKEDLRKFTPAKMNYHDVAVWYTLPITFKFQKED